MEKTTRQKQHEVATRVRASIEGCPPDEIFERYNAAFRKAKLPEIDDFADLTMLLNGDPIDPKTYSILLKKLLAVISGDEVGFGETHGAAKYCAGT